MRTRICLGMALGALLPAGLAFAAPLPFTDDFETVTTSLDTNPPGWVSLFGTVDTIDATNGYGITCAGGSNGCVDLDGSQQNPGLLLTSDSFDLVSGQQYQLSFSMSGNQRLGAGSFDDVVFGVNDAGTNATLGSDALTLAGDALFATYTLLFTAASDTAAYIFFSNTNGGDNVGPVLDNVRLAAVPIPAAGWLLISGLVGLVGVARRRQTAVPVAA